MKREFLQEFKVGQQPLPKDVIDAIMAENGRDIQKVKGAFADYEQLKNQLSALQEAAGLAEEQKTAAAAWEEKYNRAVEAHKAQLSQLAFEKNLDESIVRAKGRNARAITALLDVDTLKTSENQKEAIEEALEVLKRENRYLFEGEAAPPYAWGTGACQGAMEKAPATLAGALREKFERK